VVNDLTLIEILLFVVIGSMVGFLGGLFGVGGGIMMVPILVFSYSHIGVSPTVLTHIAIGTSLFVVIFTSLSSTYQQKKQHNIHWRSVFAIGFSSALIAFATTRVAAGLSGKHLRIAFALVVLFTAIRMLTEKGKEAQKRLELASSPSFIRLVIIGVVAGVISGLAGIGGGVITIPMMYYLLGMPLKLAIGTSSAAILITALFSVIGYVLHGRGHPDLPNWSYGFLDIYRGMALGIGTIFLARVGAYVSFRMNPYYLKRYFALFLVFISIYMLLR
jgi:uncharacterized membrane protein YfcA